MNKSKRAKNKSFFDLILFFFSFSLALALFHPSHLPSTQVLGNSSFILSSLALCAPPGSWPGRGTAQSGKQALLHNLLLLSTFPWVTGCSHRALPRGESLFGGDSQAQMFVGSDYSSLPPSSRVNRVSILTLRIFIRLPKGARLVDFSGSIPDGMTESIWLQKMVILYRKIFGANLWWCLHLACISLARSFCLPVKCLLFF